MDELDGKLERLEELLRGLGSVAVAFSGGVDSTVLLHIAHEVLGDDVVAVTATAPLFPTSELDFTRAFTEVVGARHVLVPVAILDDPAVTSNPPDRCYHCKRKIFGAIEASLRGMGVAHLVDGSNADDVHDYRPGMRALRDMAVTSPLLEVGIDKRDIRALARARSLPNWNKPSAACLASRIPYGQAVTEERLQRVEQGERLLHDEGFAAVRIRDLDGVAVIEVPPEEISRLAGPSLRTRLIKGLTRAGFRRITIDLVGYRVGSLNEELSRPQ